MIAAAIAKQQAGFGDADAAALIALMTGSPDSTRQGLIEDFIVGCKADGTWTKLDRLGLAGLNEHDSLLDWKRVTNFSSINGCAFVADRGFTAAAGKYVNMNFTPSTAGVNVTLNSSALGVYSRTDSGAVSFEAGATNSTTYQTLLEIRTVATTYVAINDATANSLNVADANSLGLYVVDRSANNVTKLYKNGSLIATSAFTSTEQANIAYFVGAVNASGAPLLESPRQIAAWLASGSLDATEHANLYSRIQTYMTGIGAQV